MFQISFKIESKWHIELYKLLRNYLATYLYLSFSFESSKKYLSLVKMVVSCCKDEHINLQSRPSIIYIILVLGTIEYTHIEMKLLVLHILEHRNIPGSHSYATANNNSTTRGSESDLEPQNDISLNGITTQVNSSSLSPNTQNAHGHYSSTWHEENMIEKKFQWKEKWT